MKSRSLGVRGPLRGGVEGELEEIVGDLGAALPGEDEHAVARHGAGEVTAGRRDVALLVNLREDEDSAQGLFTRTNTVTVKV